MRPRRGRRSGEEDSSRRIDFRREADGQPYVLSVGWPETGQFEGQFEDPDWQRGQAVLAYPVRDGGDLRHLQGRTGGGDRQTSLAGRAARATVRRDPSRARRATTADVPALSDF